MIRFLITTIFFIIIPFQLSADQNDKRLNYLFDKLIIAKDEQEIGKITNQILFGTAAMRVCGDASLQQHVCTAQGSNLCRVRGSL